MRRLLDAGIEVTERSAPDGVTFSFSDDELLALTMAVATINVFNRFNVALRTVPGTC